MGGVNTSQALQQQPRQETNIADRMETATTMHTMEPHRAPMPYEKYEPAVSQPSYEELLQANYDRINKQGMSDQGIVSPEEGIKALKGLYNDVKTAVHNKLHPEESNKHGNFFGRDVSPSPLSTKNSEIKIEEGLQAAEQ